VSNQLLSAVLDRAVPLAWRMATGFAEALERANPLRARMASNLTLTDGGIAAEAATLAAALAHRLRA
jgi:3-carboxy-cis,cis-muconate cycloisomerase